MQILKQSDANSEVRCEVDKFCKFLYNASMTLMVVPKSSISALISYFTPIIEV